MDRARPRPGLSFRPAPARTAPVSATPGSPGFTLVEMLVAIGVIALLMTMLLPVLGNARGGATLLKCLSNQRQLAVIAQAYAADHDGLLPPSSPSPLIVSTVFAHAGSASYDLRRLIRPYTTDFAVWTCPGVGTPRIDDVGNNRVAGCYGTYAYVPGRRYPDFGFTRGTPTRLDNPYTASTLTLLQDEFRDDPAPGSGGVQLYNHGDGTADSLAGNPSYGGYRGNTGDGANTVYFDGHASWTAAEQLNVVGGADSLGRRMFGVLPPP